MSISICPEWRVRKVSDEVSGGAGGGVSRGAGGLEGVSVCPETEKRFGGLVSKKMGKNIG